jgi:hypothetical protein
MFKHIIFCVLFKKQSIYVSFSSSSSKNFSSIQKPFCPYPCLFLLFFSMVETFFCSLLCIFKSYLYVFLFSNNCYSKTECKYTKSFFYASSFIKNILIFTIFAILNLYTLCFTRISNLLSLDF